MKYFAKIKYLGTDFCGFQVQPDKRTVQGELCRALKEALGAPCRVTGCSRTDSGVHANEFCLTVECEGATVPPDKLPVAVAKYLPPDLSLYYAEEARPDFHPRYDVIGKEYLYRIVNSPIYDPFDFGRAWFIPRPIDENGISVMKTCAERIIGKKDFHCFMSEGSDVTDTVRHVFYIDISKNGNIIEVRICADGFLYNMVRIIVGSLVEAAHGRFSAEDFDKMIDSRDRSNAGMTAPAHGLYLNKVSY